MWIVSRLRVPRSAGAGLSYRRRDFFRRLTMKVVAAAASAALMARCGLLTSKAGRVLVGNPNLEAGSGSHSSFFRRQSAWRGR